MQAIYEFLQRIGTQSLDAFWFPMLIWTVVAMIIFLSFRVLNRLNPLYHYHLRAATLAAIPFGLVATLGVQFFNSLTENSTAFDPAVFVVETPQAFYLANPVTATQFDPNWFEPNFILGLVTAIILLISGVMLIRLAKSYKSLKNLHASLSKDNLSTISAFEGSGFDRVKLSFYEHPLVPFTFGWKNPIIVLPTSIQDDPEKVRMAIQHELVHIKRGDYLLQLFLSVIESLFWFHPLIQWGAREIEAYREISCDQEVLNTTGISLKKYASMLYELLPLNRGLGSFSVSMAVQQSTLKKRIQTMKYHKMYKTSVKRSLFFLGVMILGVTLPIACSDLRGPQSISDEELVNTSITLMDPGFLVNGNEVTKFRNFTKEVQLNGGLSVGLRDYGTIVVSGSEFEGSLRIGKIENNKISFTHNELNFEIVSESELLNGNEAELWVKHYPKRFSSSLTYLAASKLRDGSFIESLSPELRGDLFTDDNGDPFVVVEEMPKLIGGLASVQSKVEYPELAKRAGIEGKVVLQFIVNENGDVENPKVVKGIGGGCDEAAVAAVSKAKFEPGIQRGKPVRVQFSLPIVFRLSDSDITN